MRDVSYDIFCDVHSEVFTVFKLLQFIEGHIVIKAPIMFSTFWLKNANHVLVF